MKYIAFIVLGLVLLATIGYVALWINMPMARLTIHAVRPTGTNYTCTNYLGNQQNWPFWEVAVTNNGHAPAAWFATLVLENYGRVTLGDQPTGYDSLHFSLQPGQGDSIYMLMPADSTAMWTVEVRYQSQMNGLEQKLSSWLKPVPMLRRVLPDDTLRSARDAWHVGTNVTTAR